MNGIRKIIIIYSSFMLAALLVLFVLYRNTVLSMGTVASYSEEELEVYKKVWGNINADFVTGQNMILKYTFIFWLIALISGYILILMIYMMHIRPVNEMEKYASEIAKGNLDIQLPMHRENAFGSFPESFDLMREEIKKAKQKEMEAEKGKRELMAELSHDLKTPVATIQATCEVMELQYSKKKALSANEEDLKEIDGTLEKISYIANKAETINQLVENIFHATIDDLDDVSIKPVETDSRIIEGYFKNLKEYGNIILENSIPECLVYIDKLRMEQVIDNIIGNSYKYAGTDIHVFFSETDAASASTVKDNKYIRIRISDEGPGVREDELSLITEKYYRGKDVADKKGYGLGMYLVNYYMNKQGGGMEYYNDNGFVVELLVKKV